MNVLNPSNNLNMLELVTGITKRQYPVSNMFTFASGGQIQGRFQQANLSFQLRYMSLPPPPKKMLLKSA